MKKIVVLAVAAAIAMAGTAMAAGSNNVTVNAVVLGSCTITTGSAAFGLLDPAAAIDKNAAVTVPTVTCSNGTPYTITDDLGAYESGAQKRMFDGAGNYINYSFIYTNAGTGNGVAQNVVVTEAKVLAIDYSGALPGVYADTILLTVNP